MSWLSQLIGKDKRRKAREADQAADPMGRTQNDLRLYDALRDSRRGEAEYQGNVTRSRGDTDAAIEGVGNTRWRTDALYGGGGAGGPAGGYGNIRGGNDPWAGAGSVGGGGTTRGWNPSNVQGLSFDALSRTTPGAREGYSTESLDNFRSDELGGVDVNATLDRYTGGPNRFQQAVRGGQSYAPVGQGGYLAAWDDGGLGGFDAGAMVKEYAQGAWADSEMDLKGLLAEEEAASQRGGRLNSGFFDRDKGRVITDVRNRFSNALAQQAVAAAGIMGDVRSRAAQMRLSRASDADRNILDAGLQGQRLTAADLLAADDYNLGVMGLGVDAGKAALSGSLERAGGMDRNRLSAITSGRELALRRAEGIDDFNYTRERDVAGLGLDRAKSLDEMGLDRSKFVDLWDQENAQFGDEMDFNRARDVADRRERREARDTETWLSLGDRYRDELAATDDRITNRRNAKAQARQNRFQNFITGIGTGLDIYSTLRTGTRRGGGGGSSDPRRS